MQKNNLSIIGGGVATKNYDQIEAELDAEYVKMNKGVLETKPTQELVALQANHFRQATKLTKDVTMLHKHISLISSVLAARGQAKGQQ